MKKIRAIISGVLLTILMLVMASCGLLGPSGTVGSFVNAVKAGNAEKATTCVVDMKIETLYDSEDEVEKYMWQKTVGAFKYEVKEESTDDEAGTAKISIYYEKLSYTELSLKMAAATLLNKDKWIKEQVDVELTTMEKKHDTLTLNLKKNSDGNWKLENGSATVLLAAMR